MEGQLLPFFVVVAQAAGSPPSEAIDLTVRPQCEAKSSASDEIVVCGRRSDQPNPYRLPILPPEQQQGFPPADATLASGVNLGAVTEQANVGGFPSNRLMLRLRIKF